MGEINAGDVCGLFSDLMDLLDKAQWNEYKGPAGKMIPISLADKNTIKADAAKTLSDFNAALSEYTGKLGVK